MQIKRIPLIEMKELVKIATTKPLKQEQLFASSITPLTYIEYYQKTGGYHGSSCCRTHMESG